jgi:polysaccharide deacetylase 2 family uncharacterized protein YibQ
LNLPGLFRGKKKSRPRKKTKKTARPAYLPWVLGAAVVLIMAGVGLVKWSDTRTGQAALLSMGSQKMYSEVQLAVEQALIEVFPDFVPGPANAAAEEADPADFDWPAPELGPGAHVRCRRVAVPADIPYRSLELQVARALEPLGARILWGQRLYPDYPGQPAGRTLHPDEQADHLRLDLGVPGKPTHTVVLYRRDSGPSIRWGFGPELSAWSRLSAHGQNPVVALVIDDWGYGKTQATRELQALPVPLTMAVLPGLSYSREFSLAKTDLVLPPDQLAGAAGKGQSSAPGRFERLAAGCFVEVATGPDPKRLPERRREILLHLPMEPQGYPETDPGPQAVMVGMGQDEIQVRLEKALAGLDRVTGVNNHMGSAATSDPATMKNLMDVLQARGLLFLDSLTSASSVAYQTALAEGIPALKNRIFLDYDNEDEQKIAAHLHSLVKAARAGGFAVGIGHPHPATARVLTREIPRLAAQGVVFVTVSEMYALQQQREGILP